MRRGKSGLEDLVLLNGDFLFWAFLFWAFWGLFFIFSRFLKQIQEERDGLKEFSLGFPTFCLGFPRFCQVFLAWRREMVD